MSSTSNPEQEVNTDPAANYPQEAKDAYTRWHASSPAPTGAAAANWMSGWLSAKAEQ